MSRTSSLADILGLLHGPTGTRPLPRDPLDLAAGERDGPPLAFRFCHREVPFTGRLLAGPGGARRLEVTGELGILPFSVEAAQARRQALAALAAARADTGLAWRLNAGQALVVVGTAPLETPLTPTRIVGAAVRLLLEADAHLALLAEVLGTAAPVTARQAA